VPPFVDSYVDGNEEVRERADDELCRDFRREGID
jgi:hypothetical protein